MQRKADPQGAVQYAQWKSCPRNQFSLDLPGIHNYTPYRLVNKNNETVMQNNKSSGRRKHQEKTSPKNNKRKANSTRRKNPPQLHEQGEQRHDMKIIVSASQGDIYTWAISIATIATIIGAIVTMALLKGSP